MLVVGQTKNNGIKHEKGQQQQHDNNYNLQNYNFGIDTNEIHMYVCMYLVWPNVNMKVENGLLRLNVCNEPLFVHMYEYNTQFQYDINLKQWCHNWENFYNYMTFLRIVGGIEIPRV